MADPFLVLMFLPKTEQLGIPCPGSVSKNQKQRPGTRHLHHVRRCPDLRFAHPQMHVAEPLPLNSVDTTRDSVCGREIKTNKSSAGRSWRSDWLSQWSRLLRWGRRVIFQGCFEAADAFPDSLAEIRQFFWPEDEQGNAKNE